VPHSIDDDISFPPFFKHPQNDLRRILQVGVDQNVSRVAMWWLLPDRKGLFKSLSGASSISP